MWGPGVSLGMGFMEIRGCVCTSRAPPASCAVGCGDLPCSEEKWPPGDSPHSTRWDITGQALLVPQCGKGESSGYDLGSREGSFLRDLCCSMPQTSWDPERGVSLLSFTDVGMGRGTILLRGLTSAPRGEDNYCFF